MIRHVVMWKLKDTLTSDEKMECAHAFKDSIEALDCILEGIIKVEVILNEMESSNMDVLLISDFESEEVLIAYQNHPEHKKAAAHLKDRVALRSCVDYPQKQ